MSLIRPYYGSVILTDRTTRYPDASDHNAVFAKLKIDDGLPSVFGTNVLTFNVRRYSFDLNTAYDWNKYRDHEAAQLIAESEASIVALQECEPQQDTYLAKKLPELTGVGWNSISARTNVGLMYKADRWRMLTYRNVLMDNGGETDRRVVLALMQSIRVGRAVWFGSTHFGVGLNFGTWRRYQARKVCELLSNIERTNVGEEAIPNEYFGDQRKNAVIMGDFNDWADYKHTGVRQVFSQHGLYELRDRLSDAAMHGDSYSTKHKFGDLTPHDGRQIDAILTPR